MDTLHTIDTQWKQGKYGEYIEITFVDNDCNPSVTYVDPGMRNYWRWAEVCNNPDRAYIITGCKFKRNKFNREGHPIINADSVIQVLDWVPMEQMLRAVKEMLDEVAE